MCVHGSTGEGGKGGSVWSGGALGDSGAGTAAFAAERDAGGIGSDRLGESEAEVFLDEVAEAGVELRMAGGGLSPDETKLQVVGQMGGLVIEIVEDFHVVAEEAEREQHDGLHA